MFTCFTGDRWHWPQVLGNELTAVGFVLTPPQKVALVDRYCCDLIEVVESMGMSVEAAVTWLCGPKSRLKIGRFD